MSKKLWILWDNWHILAAKLTKNSKKKESVKKCAGFFDRSRQNRCFCQSDGIPHMQEPIRWPPRRHAVLINEQVQDMSQKLKDKVLQTARKYQMFGNDSHIIIGLSGGPDSICLFDVLREIAANTQLKLYAVHINHCLRPGAADEDQAYVEKICESAGVPCRSFRVDCNEMASRLKMTSEEAGRKARYDSFSAAARHLADQGIPREKIAIALAHNANDNAETVLFRIIRGTGTDGLAGIPYKRTDKDGFAIVRPILDISREEIENYCRIRGLNPRIDHTNSENIYTRNKIRNLLIPYIRENFNENFTDCLNRLSRIASEDRDCLKMEAEEAFRNALCPDETGETRGSSDMQRSGSKRLALKLKPLQGLHKAVRIRVYTTALEQIGMEQNMSYNQAEGIEQIRISESPSASFSLSGSVKVCREYDKLVFLETGEDSMPDGMPSGWRLKQMTYEMFKDFRRKAERRGTVYGAFEGVSPDEIKIRTRLPGDRINIGTGAKKIKDLLIDEKVPKVYRDDILLLARGSDVLWVLPSEHFTSGQLVDKGRFSADFKVGGTKTDKVIVLEKL